MKKTFFAFLTAILTLLVFTLQVSAFGNLNVNLASVDVSGVEVVGQQNLVVSASGGDSIPVRVIFRSNESQTVSDARVEVEINGYRTDISDETERFAILPGTTYSKLLSLELPTDIDLSEDYLLEVKIFTKDKSFEESFNLRLQRDSYVLEILSIDSDREVKAGETLAVDIVIKNRGFERLDDLFVVATIPEIGVDKRAYFEDLTPVDIDIDSDRRDSEERRIYLQIPEDVASGVYKLEVIAYNSDTNVEASRRISVVGVEDKSEVFVPVTTKELKKGETKTYDLVIVNRGDSLKVYEIIPEAVEGIDVSVDTPVVAVSSDSSVTVKVTVEADEEGTHSFAVNVRSDGEVVSRNTLVAKVTEETVRGVSNITVLTIILGILFVVLFIVLVVLLTRKPARKEELEESYY